KLYCMATVISPYCPPMTSWSLRAKTASGFSGVEGYCRVCLWMNMFKNLPCRSVSVVIVDATCSRTLTSDATNFRHPYGCRIKNPNIQAGTILAHPPDADTSGRTTECVAGIDQATIWL